jgi:hypothetical protein
MNRRTFLVDCTTAALLPGSSPSGEQLSSRAGRIVVGDSRLLITIAYGGDGLEEETYEVDGVRIAGLVGMPWGLDIDGREYTAAARAASLVSSEGGDPAQRVTFEGDNRALKWTLTYQVSGSGRIEKHLSFTPAKVLKLGRVSLWKARSSAEPKIASTAIQDIAVFYRQEDRGLFASLDFPYSKIIREGNTAEVTYPARLSLGRGQKYVCHSLTVGSIRLTGRARYGYDEGEVAAVDDYIQERYKVRFNRPMFVSSSIVNRYTQVRGDVVFYTMKDQPTLSFNLDLLKQDLELMPKLGIEYYQVFPGVFDWVPDDPSADVVHRMSDFARSHGVRIGDYSGSNYLFCPHFNQYLKRLNRPDWLMVDSDGKSKDNPFCFGNSAFVSFYIGTVVPNCDRFAFELHCLDFLCLKPCYAAQHDHPPGPESLYAQVSGLLRLLKAINEASPQMMTWSNSGDWTELLPKLAWTNPNLYLTDPFIASPWQGLNMTRLLDDSRREQMVFLHQTKFLPYRFLTNCQYFFCQDSVVPDIRNFKYGALSTVAVTPNLGLGEIRPWIERLGPGDQKEAIKFYRNWTEFLQRHYTLWSKTFQAGGNPGLGSVEIYSHADGSHGFVFIINPHYWSRTVEVPLDSTLGFTTSGQCEIVEVYPVERHRLTSQGPFASLGTKLAIHVQAQQVLVLEVKPAPAKLETPALYGIPGSIEPTKQGYLIKTRGPQGITDRFAVLTPLGGSPITDARVRPDIPKQDKRLWTPTPIKPLASDRNATLFEITYRRRAAPTELREWSVLSGDFDEGIAAGWNMDLGSGEVLKFPLFVDTYQDAEFVPMSDQRADELGLGPLANFLGAYIDHAFSEPQETWIDMAAGEMTLPQAKIASGESVPSRRPLHPMAKDSRKTWWLRTAFFLPFINSDGTKPAPDGHPILALPLIRQRRVQVIKAWLNKLPLAIVRYAYPRNPNLGCYYADLIGSGARGQDQNTLVVHVRFDS